MPTPLDAVNERIARANATAEAQRAKLQADYQAANPGQGAAAAATPVATPVAAPALAAQMPAGYVMWKGQAYRTLTGLVADPAWVNASHGVRTAMFDQWKKTEFDPLNKAAGDAKHGNPERAKTELQALRNWQQVNLADPKKKDSLLDTDLIDVPFSALTSSVGGVLRVAGDASGTRGLSQYGRQMQDAAKQYDDSNLSETTKQKVLEEGERATATLHKSLLNSPQFAQKHLPELQRIANKYGGDINKIPPSDPELQGLTQTYDREVGLGTWDTAKNAVQDIYAQPVNKLTQSLGAMVPTLAVGAAATALGVGAGAAAAVGTAANAIMSAGEASGDYDKVFGLTHEQLMASAPKYKAQLAAMGDTPQNRVDIKDRLAVDAQNGGAVGRAIVAAVTGWAGRKVGLDAVFTGNAAKTGALKHMGGSALEGAADEAGMAAIGNVAVGAVDTGQRLGQGVVAAGVQGAVLEAGMGGLAGHADGHATAVPPSGVRAVNAANAELGDLDAVRTLAAQQAALRATMASPPGSAPAAAAVVPAAAAPVAPLPIGGLDASGVQAFADAQANVDTLNGFQQPPAPAVLGPAVGRTGREALRGPLERAAGLTPAAEPDAVAPAPTTEDDFSDPIGRARARAAQAPVAAEPVSDPAAEEYLNPMAAAIRRARGTTVATEEVAHNVMQERDVAERVRTAALDLGMGEVHTPIAAQPEVVRDGELVVPAAGFTPQTVVEAEEHIAPNPTATLIATGIFAQENTNGRQPAKDGSTGAAGSAVSEPDAAGTGDGPAGAGQAAPAVPQGGAGADAGQEPAGAARTQRGDAERAAGDGDTNGGRSDPAGDSGNAAGGPPAPAVREGREGKADPGTGVPGRLDRSDAAQRAKDGPAQPDLVGRDPEKRAGGQPAGRSGAGGAEAVTAPSPTKPPAKPKGGRTSASGAGSRAVNARVAQAKLALEDAKALPNLTVQHRLVRDAAIAHATQELSDATQAQKAHESGSRPGDPAAGRPAETPAPAEAGIDAAKARLDAAKAHYVDVVAKRAELAIGSPPHKATTPAYHAAEAEFYAARADHEALVAAGRDALTRPRGGDVKSAPAAQPLFRPGEMLAFSADISPALRGVTEGWANMLGLDRVRLVVSTPSGGTKLAAERGLVAGTKEHQMLTRPMPAAADGSVGAFPGYNVESIMLKPGMSERKTLEILAHEMGHTLQRHTFDSAPEAVQQEIRNAHQAWLAARRGNTAGQFMTALRPFGEGDAGIRPSLRADPRPMEQSLSPKDLAYIRSFEEWFADNTAKWATSRAEPLGVVDKFFKDLADKLRAFFLGAPEMHKPDETLAKWLDSLNPKFRADQVLGATDFDPNDPGPDGSEHLSQHLSEPVMAQAEYSRSITPPKAIGAAMKWAAARLEGNDRARTVDEYRAQAEGRAMPKRNLLAGHNISGRLMDTFVDTLVKAEVAFTDEHRRAEEQAQTILKKTGASGVQLAQYRARLDRAVADLRASSARLVLEARLFRNKGDAFLRQHNSILDNVQGVIAASKPEGVEIDAWRARANLYAQAVHIIDRHAAKSAELRIDIAKARMALRRAEAQDNVPGGAKGEGDKLAAAKAALAAYDEANDAEPTRTTNERGEAVDTFAFPMPGGVRLKDAQAVVAAGADQQAGLRAVQEALVEGFRSLNRLAVQEGRAAKSDIDALEAAFPHYVSLMGNSEREVTDLGNTKRRAFIDSSRGATHAGQAVMPDEALGHKLKGLAAGVGRAEFDQMLLAHAQLNRTGSIPLTVNGRTGPDMLELPTSNIVRLASDFGPEETRPDDLHIRRIQSGMANGEVSETQVAIDNPAVVDGLFEVPFIETELGRTAARATRVYGMMVTRFTAAFAPLNMARDMGERLFNIVGLQGRELNARQVNQVRAHMVGLVKDAQTWADIKSYAFDGPDAFVKARPDSPLARLAKAGGLTTLTQFLANEAQYDKAILARGSVPAQAWGKVKHAVEVYNQLFETLVPLATFDALQTVAGMDDQTAAGVTARMFDLRARGKVAPHMSALYTFFSPTAYGAKTFLETMNSGPRAKAELLGMAAAAGMLYLVLQGMDDEDENGKPLLDAQNDALTDGSIPIPLGGGSYAKLPMSFGGPRFAWILGVRTLRVMQGVDSPYDGVAAVVNEVVKTLLPTGVSQESVVENPSRFLAKTITPSALKGLTNLATNTNSFGTPLTHASREGEYKSEQGQYTTPEVYSDMARSVREATGGMLDSSPESVRELLGSALVGPAAALLTLMANGDKEAKGLTESVMRDGITGAMVQSVGGGRLLSTQSDDARDRFLVNKLSARAIHLVREVNVRNPHVGTGKETHEDKMQRAEAAGMEGNDLAILDAYFQYQGESHSTGRKLSKLRAAKDRDLDELKDAVSEQQVLTRRFIAAGAAL